MSDAEIKFSPSAPQLKFLQAHQKYVCYGGARGGGKSFIIQRKADMLANKWPGIRILIMRKTFRELENNHIGPMLKLIGKRAKYNRSDKKFTYPNGSVIAFSYCANDGDLLNLQGTEWDCVMFDESTNMKEEWIKEILVCLRGTVVPFKRAYFCCNPGGVSHHFHKRLFVDRRFLPGEDPEEYVFIPARVTDNKALAKMQPDYIRQLDSLPPKLRKAWRDGSWDIFEGAFFETWTNDPTHYEDRRWTHVISGKDFTLPTYWEVYRSFDWGYRRPFSMGYWAIDGDGVIYRIAEFYGCQRDILTRESIPNEGLKWTPDKVFQEIREFENNHPLLKDRDISGVADPAIWDKETGISIAETAAKYGIYFKKGDNRRQPGWMQCQYRLQFDKQGFPRMYVLDTCKDFLRTIPMQQYDDHKPEELDTSLEDHQADEFRYFAMQHMIQPMEAKPAMNYMTDPLDMFSNY